MYYLARTGSDPVPLDFNTPRHTDSVADALGSDTGSQCQSAVGDLDTAALLTEVGLSDLALREVLGPSSDPGR